MNTAMNENSKQQVVSNDLIRRLLNTSQNMGATEFRKVVDQYGQKLLNSGYDPWKQTWDKRGRTKR